MNLQKRLNVSTADLKEKRVSNFVDSAKSESESVIRAHEQKIRELENELENVMDLGDDTTLSIANRISKTNPLAFIRRIHELKLEIHDQKETLALIKATHDELFSE